VTRSSQAEERFDALAAQVHEWTESAVALDEGHFPNELISDLQDLVEELKAFLEDEGEDFDRQDVTELFVTPEMAEIVDRFPRVRRLLEGAWGSRVMDLIGEESSGFEPLEDDDD
jgi:hypothetical protein